LLTPAFGAADYCIADFNFIRKLAILKQSFRHLTPETGILTQFKTGTPDGVIDIKSIYVETIPTHPNSLNKKTQTSEDGWGLID
jgi:hypothetical protein